MDVVTDLSSQCASFITVYQEICKSRMHQYDAGDKTNFSFFCRISDGLETGTLIFNDDLRKRIEEVIWSGKDEIITNHTLQRFFDHCKEIIKWIDDYRSHQTDFMPGNLYSSAYEWRVCIREIIYAEKKQRISLIRILEYMPIQIIWCLGGQELTFAQQRLLQIWEPNGKLNQLSKPDDKFNKDWWELEWKNKTPDAGDNDQEDKLTIGGSRAAQALTLLIDDRKILEALKREESPIPFETLFTDELDEIVESRKIRKQIAAPANVWDGVKDDPINGDPHLRAKSLDLYALAFSGGGIRSATFNLGILQKLAETGLLARFDYLSTVSGGGYIGSWLESWIQRSGSMSKVMDRLNPKKSGNPLADEVRPIRWLRMFSNYLTPNAGLMSADSWTMGVTWLRNTVINQVILLLLLCSVLSVIRGVYNSWVLIPSANVVEQWLVAIASFVVLVPGAVLAGWGMHAYNPEHPPKSLDLEKSNWLYVALLIWGVISTFLLSGWLYSHANCSYTFLGKVYELKWAGATGLAALLLIAFLGAYQKCYQNAKNLFWVYVAIFVSSILSAGCGLLLLCLSWQLFEKIINIVSLPTGFKNNKLAFIVGVPMVLEALSITVVVRMAIMGVLFPDLRREWWGRMGALVHRFIFIWLVVAFSALILPEYLVTLPYKKIGVPVLFGGWSGIIGYAVKLAFGPKISGQKPTDGSTSPAEIFVKAAPYIFAVGFLLIGSLTLKYIEQIFTGSVPLAHKEMAASLKLLLRIGIGIGLGIFTFLLSWRVGVNEFSLHHFYRNRLSRAYLGATRRREDRERTANNFTGFDGKDDLLLSKLLVKNKYMGPYPILNVTLNSTVVSASSLDKQDRKAESFVFTPQYCGFDFCRSRPSANSEDNPYEYGYRPTGEYAYPEGPHLSTAMAISGAAINPNMGYHSSPAIAFLLTIFNVRLGWWMGNPRTSSWKRADPVIGIFYLVKDLFGSSNINSKYVCLSDGGHFDNMGVYELIRRRCKHIVLCDAEEDEKSTCEGLSNAIRRCRIDFGVEINLVVDPITKKDKETGYCKQHLVKGTINYPGDKVQGTIVYIKTALTGDEAVDIREYFIDNPPFPQQSTADQFFDESQFESYRKLGYSSIN